MGFALTLFVEAANGRVRPATPPQTVVSVMRDEVCRHLYDTLSVDEVSATVPQTAISDHEMSLYAAFKALCSHYDGDPLQAAVCARVLAFYFLMERSAGTVLDGWMESDPEKPHFITLHPAVVDAIAAVQLDGTEPLSPVVFLELVGTMAAVNQVPG